MKSATRLIGKTRYDKDINIPKDWQIAELGRLVDLITGYPFPSDEYSLNPSHTRLLRGDNVMQCTIRWNDARYWRNAEQEELRKFRLSVGDIVLAMDRTWVSAGLKCSLVRSDDLPSYLVQRVARIRARPDSSTDFLFLHLCSHRFEQYVKGNQKEMAVPHISSRQIEEFPIPLPPLPEQKKIAEILSTWDAAIEQIRKLIDSKKLYKNGLMQKLYTGHIRFDDPNGARNTPRKRGNWQWLSTTKIFFATSKKGHGDEPVLSVTQDQGVVLRKELERKINMSESNTDSYKLVEPGDFIISLRSFQGGLEYSRYRGIVSPAYHVIRPNLPINDEFYQQYFKSVNFIGHLAVAVIGIRDGKQISLDDISFVKLPYPPIAEQNRIGKFFQTVDDELYLLNKKLRMLELQKKALMQKLLTGQIRVRVDNKQDK